MKQTDPVLAILLLTSLACGPTSDQDYTDRMATEHREDRPVPSGAATADPDTTVETEEVTYATLDGNEITGYLARPAETTATPPGIIVIQEWWGLNDNIRSMTRRLAGEGYVALAVDLYEGEVADDAEKARSLMSASMKREQALEDNLRQAYRYLADEIGTPRVGTIGWCFGGGWSLRTALLLPNEIDATVIYYGRLTTDRDRLATLSMPVLGIFGAEDEGIPVDNVRRFESVLQERGKDAEIHVYEGADHAFANPSGTRYDAEAAEDAWAKTLAFFESHLKAD